MSLGRCAAHPAHRYRATLQKPPSDAPAQGDVQFKDSDGDLVTLRPKGAMVDMYVGSDLRLSNARMSRDGNMLKLSGVVTKGTPLSFLGFNIEENLTEGVTPVDPADADRAMELVG